MGLEPLKPDARLFEMTFPMKQYQIVQCHIFFLFSLKCHCMFDSLYSVGICCICKLYFISNSFVLHQICIPKYCKLVVIYILLLPPKFVGINTLNRLLLHMRQAAGIKRKTVHCFRATCASSLFNSSVASKLILIEPFIA